MNLLARIFQLFCYKFKETHGDLENWRTLI